MKKVITLGIFLVGLLVSVIPAFAGEGHDAGYRWAAKHGITDTSYNNGNSNSFNEGVRQYASEHQYQ